MHKNTIEFLRKNNMIFTEMTAGKWVKLIEEMDRLHELLKKSDNSDYVKICPNIDTMPVRKGSVFAHVYVCKSAGKLTHIR